MSEGIKKSVRSGSWADHRSGRDAGTDVGRGTELLYRAKWWNTALPSKHRFGMLSSLFLANALDRHMDCGAVAGGGNPKGG